MSIEIEPGAAGIVDRAHFGAWASRSSGAPPETVPAGCTVVVCTRHRPALLTRFLDSLADQSPRPTSLVVVDASEDGRTRAVLEQHVHRDRLADSIEYCRVDASLTGVTRQRNLGLSMVDTELAAFFDDDVVLLPGCLAALEAAHRRDPDLAGVGARIENERGAPPLIWRLRRLLFIVPSLEAGRYFGSGVSTPWGFASAAGGVFEGDWLPGGAVMWKTRAARANGFADRLDGYGVGNDLEFSLRMSRFGRQVLAADARLLHLQESGGRPDPRRLGYEALRNWHYIHRVGGGDRFALRLWFGYAVLADTALQSLNLLRPSRTRDTWNYLRGAGRFLRERLHPLPVIGAEGRPV